MSNTTKRPVIEWLCTIADPIVRESAIRQCIDPNFLVGSLSTAILDFAVWERTKEGHEYWRAVRESTFYDANCTIESAATDWMDEVHQMD